MATITAGQRFYNDQVRFCETRDIPGIRSHYADDATLISFDNQIHGGDAIAEYFAGYLQRMSGLKLRSTDKFVETADAIFFEATIDLDAGVAKVYDAFVLENVAPSTTSRACSGSRPRVDFVPRRFAGAVDQRARISTVPVGVTARSVGASGSWITAGSQAKVPALTTRAR